MAATATTTAPAEAEIRAAVEAAWRDYANDNPAARLLEIAHGFVDPIAWHEETDDGERIQIGDAIWSNLRPTEAARLNELLDSSCLRAASRAHEVIMEELVATALTFAAEYPDAPRGPVGNKPTV